VGIGELRLINVMNAREDCVHSCTRSIPSQQQQEQQHQRRRRQRNGNNKYSHTPKSCDFLKDNLTCCHIMIRQHEFNLMQHKPEVIFRTTPDSTDKTRD